MKNDSGRDLDYWRLREVLANDYAELSQEESVPGYSQLYKELSEFLGGSMHFITQTACLNERV